MGDTGEAVSSIANVLGKSTPSDKLILFGGIWVTLAFFSNFLSFPVELIATAMGVGAIVMLAGFAGASYARKKVAEQEMEMARLKAGFDLSTGDMEMLAAMSKAGPMREHDIFHMSFPYDDKQKAAEIRGKHKLLRVKYLCAGGHVEERGGEYTAISGSDETIMMGD